MPHVSQEKIAASSEDWPMRCTNAQRALTLWQIQRGTRHLERSPMETLAKHLTQMLESWEHLHPYVTED
eukprot:3416008-Amphidinium_carterae.1